MEMNKEGKAALNEYLKQTEKKKNERNWEKFNAIYMGWQQDKKDVFNNYLLDNGIKE